MANAHVLYTNKIRSTPASAVTPSSSATGYGAENLYDGNYGTAWRSTAAGAAAQTITVDFGAAVQVKAVGLGNCNVRSTATLTIAAHTADSWGAPAFGPQTITATGMTGRRRNLYHKLSAAQTYRYWRLSMLDNGNPDGFIELGEFWLGNHVELTDQFSESYAKRRLRGNVELRTEYDQAYVYARDHRHEFDLSWDGAADATVAELSELEYTVEGNREPFFFVFNPTDPAEAYFVRLANGAFGVQQIIVGASNIGLQLIEETPGLMIPK